MDHFQCLETALQPHGFVTFQPWSISANLISSLGQAAPAALVEVSANPHWEAIAQGLQSLSPQVHTISLKAHQNFIYMLFSRVPQALTTNLSNEQEWMEVLGRTCGSLQENMTKFRLSEPAKSVVHGAASTAVPGLGAGLSMLLSLAQFSGQVVAVQLLIQQWITDEFLAVWRSTDLTRRPWGGKGIVESWLWSINAREVYGSGHGGFEVPFGFAPGVSRPEHLAQNIRQLCF